MAGSSKQLAVALLGLASAACGGGLGHRSVAEFRGSAQLGPGVRKVVLDFENGTIGVAPSADPGAPPQVESWGGARRAADTAEMLARIEQVPLTLEVDDDSGQGEVLRLRAPRLPAATEGVIGVELSLRMPAGIELEIEISGSGHVTLGDREGRSVVRTGRGDLRFENCRGAVEARTGQGNVIAFGQWGDLDLRTMEGDMQAFVPRPGRVLRLWTGRGTVQCHVPPGLQFDLDARAEVGRIGSDFGLTATKVGDYGAALAARRGEAATEVVLRTGSGHLSFQAHEFD